MVLRREEDSNARSINQARESDQVDQATEYDGLIPVVTANPDPKAANFFESVWAKLTRFSRTYYLLLIIKPILFGTYTSLLAIFMEYLFTGCGLSYQESAYFVVGVPCLALLILTTNTILSRHYDYLTTMLCVIPISMAAFLWLSAFLTDKGIWFAVFGTITLALSSGLVNPIIDGFLARIMPRDVAGFGASLNMTTMGVASMLMPAVNGYILGNTATEEGLANCCYFMGVVVSIGIVFTWLLALEIKREAQGKLEKDELTAG